MKNQSCHGKKNLSILDGQTDNIKMPCISPIETASNKISALTWRISQGDRDPTLIRHLHDLAILKDMICANKEIFSKMVIDTLKHDLAHRYKGTGKYTAQQALQYMLSEFTNTQKHQSDYTNYVLSMSYEETDKQISYNDAIKKLYDIINIIK